MKLTLIFYIIIGAGGAKNGPKRFVFSWRICNFEGIKRPKMTTTSSLYVHIPFCKRLCGYCDFYKTMSLGRKAEVVDALCEEIARRAPMLESTVLKTIYFGGGTPTVCTADELGQIVAAAREVFDCSEVEEMTIEANPDDLTDDYLQGLRRVGFNRLSIGIQSFADEDLQFMNRRHDGAGAVRAVEAARRAGFDNISIDLIYGLPTATEQGWRANVEQAVALGVEHISAYHLTIEEGTLFGKRGVKTAPEEVADREYEILCEVLGRAGYDHYEISNFSLPDRRSKHNSAYWRGTPYLGVGPAAHSYDGVATRSWNVASVARYLEGVRPEEEHLSIGELYEEYVMVRLRTKEGLSVSEVEQRFGREYVQKLLAAAEQFVGCDWLVSDGDQIRCAEEHWLVSDAVIAELF
ncbi:MAG: radical SAM family heme chaperone HemW [Rikenellaceae bacterium]|nr:radical SAM family heme chaperone HemW [Rikenellaceae bacterium]